MKNVHFMVGDLCVCIVKAPTQLWKSLEEFRAHEIRMGKYDMPKDAWPCMQCGAKGYYHDPDDPPDVVEGYKLVRRLKCVVCGGAGTSIDGAECKRAYKTHAGRYKAECFIFREKVARLTAVLNGMNASAIELLTDNLSNCGRRKPEGCTVIRVWK